jgi:N6-adenosine-specific RNA methylase IME4
MKYATIVADPPWAGSVYTRPAWSWREGRPSGEERELDYPTLELDDLAALPVRDLAAKDAHLYLWTTNAHLRETYWLSEAWGFTPSCTLVWCKEPHGFGPGGTFQSNVEFVIFARRGSLPALSKQTTRWYRWPRSEHSAKPEAFLDLVEAVSPAPRLEMFARRNRLGWDTWGNESLEHVEVAV